jgi:hypothetical protein
VRYRFENITSARFNGDPVTRPSALSARTTRCVTTRTLAIVSHLTLRFGDARKVSLLVPPGCFRSKQYKSLFFDFNGAMGVGGGWGGLNLLSRLPLPFEIDARALVIDGVDILVLQVAKCLELHRVV